MEPSVFTKIIRGELPSHKVYEDDKTLVFMSIQPIQPGQVVVVPKVQVETVWDLEPEDYQALMETMKKVGKRMLEVLKPPRVGVQIEGFEVPHAHIKMFPIANGAEFHNIPADIEPDHAALAEMAKKLSF